MSDLNPKYRYLRFTIVCLFIISATGGHCQNDLGWGLGSYPSVDFTSQEYETLKDLSEQHKGQTKLKSVETHPHFILSKEEHWHPGSWGRGYFTDESKENTEDFLERTLQDHPIACHPLYRKTSKFGRGHLHLYVRTGDSDHLEFVKDGIDFLLFEIHKDGGFMQWNNRCLKEDTLHSGKNGPCYENHTDLYPSSYALRFLCEVSLSGIDYRYSEVNEAIATTADFLIKKMNFEGLGNSNNQGLVSWALAGAYKVTLDCKHLNAAKQICENLIRTQHLDGEIEHGIWKTGVLEYDDTQTFQYYHDTRIYYHFMTVRGMIETLSIIQDEDESFKNRLVFSIKSAINHVLKYRVNESDGLNLFATSDAGTTVNFTPVFSDRLSGEYVEPIMLLAKYTVDNRDYFTTAERETLLNFANKLAKTMQDRLVSSDDAFFKRNLITGIAYYARYKKAIEDGHQVLHWDNSPSTLEFESTAGNYVSGDFDNDGKQDDIATFSDNELGGTRIHVWNSTGTEFINQEPNGWWSSAYFNLEKATKKIVSGDFDNDQFKDDIAVLYDNGNGQTNIRVWISTGTTFVYQGDNGWEVLLNYNSDNIKWRVVSGDFDEDGFEDDIAALFKVDSGGTRLDTWLSDGNSFGYQNLGWWNNSGYNANLVTGRVLSGDFDRDGYADDIAAFYDGGNDVTRVHVWSSNGSSFDYQGLQGWWDQTGYPANKLTGRVVAGNFDGDKYNDNIAAFYDGGNNQSRIDTWSSDGGLLNYSGNQGWWNSADYNSADIAGKIVSVNFNENLNLDDIIVFNDQGKYHPRIHVWKSQVNSFYYTGDDSWWLTCSYDPPISFEALPLLEEEWDFEYTAYIYPNPIDPLENELKIEIVESDGSIVDYVITSMSGVSVLKGTTEKTIDVSSLQAGLYIIVFTYRGQEYTYKFFKP